MCLPVDTVDTVDTVDMVYTVNTVNTLYTIETALHSQNIGMFAYIYCKERSEHYWNKMSVTGWMGDWIPLRLL